MINEHSHIQRNLRLGVTGEKTAVGEIHVGMKTTFATKKDKEFSSIEGFEGRIENFTIPTIKEVMEGGKDNALLSPEQ